MAVREEGSVPITIAERISEELDVSKRQIEAAIELFDGGATVPFVARYRKEATGGLDDAQLRALSERLLYLRELEDRRAAILTSIESQGKLTDALRASLERAITKTELEDLYLPYRPIRRTKATIAREAGLEPLARALFEDPTQDPVAMAANYVDADRGVADVDAALQGAGHILIEDFSRDTEVVQAARTFVHTRCLLVSKVVRGKQDDPEAQRFRDYFEHHEPLSRVAGHRALAMFRARKEGFVRLLLGVETSEGSIEPLTNDPTGHGLGIVSRRFGLENAGRAADTWLLQAAGAAFCDKVALHVETDAFVDLREAAETEAISVFAANLRDLLLAAPAGPKTILGLDPGIRTGCKIAVVDRTGKLLETATIYPHAPRNDTAGSIAVLDVLCTKHGVELVAIGNGTGSRETDALVSDLQRRRGGAPIKVVVSEAGASVYSASERGSREFPDLDVSLRGAVSIARRLQDPLAELVKIDPKSIGVGQYQHDVQEKQLSRSLDAVVEDCVNSVGVDLNTASVDLLSRVAGLGPVLATNIVAHRDAHGPFASRKALLKVARLGPKAFEQCAGFLRIRGGVEPLDASAVHPEAYAVVERIVLHTRRAVHELMGDGDYLKRLDPSSFVDERFGVPTIVDILHELEKPGRDPRPAFRAVEFDDSVHEIGDLQPGMELDGVVTNVTNFGAFVDVGVHQDGLVHISRLADRFVEDPREVVKAGQIVRVKVLEVDVPRKRIGLTMRLQDVPGEAPARGAGRDASRAAPGGRGRDHGGRGRTGADRGRREQDEPPNPLAEQLARWKRARES
ncbi:MAG: RNA-binding transcriptional accessory protein [Planctomycetes bacterium]|nr:RNA-binding transcriptional accessory protein [Planctomycetota bacterium]